VQKEHHCCYFPQGLSHRDPLREIRSSTLRIDWGRVGLFVGGRFGAIIHFRCVCPLGLDVDFEHGNADRPHRIREGLLTNGRQSA
jgi:hypothetical protein